MQSCHKTHVDQILSDDAKHKSNIVILQNLGETSSVFVRTHCEIINVTKKLSNIVLRFVFICLMKHWTSFLSALISERKDGLFVVRSSFLSAFFAVKEERLFVVRSLFLSTSNAEREEGLFVIRSSFLSA